MYELVVHIARNKIGVSFLNHVSCVDVGSLEAAGPTWWSYDLKRLQYFPNKL